MLVCALRLFQIMTVGIILIVLPFCSSAKWSVTRIGIRTFASRLSGSASGALAAAGAVISGQDSSLLRSHAHKTVA